jgi:ferredoxin
MAYTITEPCIGVKDTACVVACPVDCIHPTREEPGYETEEMLYIDPETCIDCGACEPECPVEAIFENEYVPEKWQHFIERNAAYYRK